MDTQHTHWTRRRIRTAHSLLSIGLMLSMVFGGLIGPWLMPPAQSQASTLAQQPEAIDIGKVEESEFSPHMKASYGELITYTLVFTVGQGLHSGIVITDTYHNPSGAIYLPVTPTNSFGPYPISGAGVPDPLDATMNIYWPPSTPGRPVVYWHLLDDIDNTSGGNWVFGLRYRARVHTDNQVGNPTRKIASTAKIDWDQGGPITDTAVEVWLAQPHNFSFSKSQVPPENTVLNPGATVTWTLALRDQIGDYQGSAYDILVTDTLPGGIITATITAPAPTSTYSVQGNMVIFSVPELPPTAYDTNLKIRAHLPITQNVAHGKVYNEADLYRSSAPGTPAGERTWLSEDSTTAYIKNITLGKAQSSAVYYNNSNRQAVAGEEVTVTVNIVVPEGTVIYDPRVRILVEDGMTITQILAPTPGYDLVITDPASQDPDKPAGTYWTQYQWSKLDSISDTNSGAYTYTMSFRALVRQHYFLPDTPNSGKEIPHGTYLDIVPIVRWAYTPTGTVEDTPCSTSLCQRNIDSNPNVSPQFIRPDLRYASAVSGSYFDTSGAFQGNGDIAFTLNLRNRSGSPQYPTAYPETANSLMEVLSPDLTYESATPAPDSVLVGASGTTLTWDVTGVITNNTLPYVVNASLPPEMVVGLVVTATAHARYSTFAGTSVPNEGVYYDAPPATNPPYTAQKAILGGFFVTKTVTPADNVRIGDTVTYTVRLEVNEGMVMYVPSFSDVLPRGFHYVDGSLVVDNGELTGTVSYTGTGSPNYQQRMSWKLETVDNRGGGGTEVVLAHYRAVMTGLDWRYGQNGNPVWASSRADMVNKQNADNAVTTCWQVAAGPGQPTQCWASTVRARTRVVQPFLADTPPWNKVRTEAVNEYEVGDQVNFKVTFKNSGAGPAYDVVLKDLLPTGIAFADSWVEPNWIIMDEPPYTSTGEISWLLEEVPAGQQVDVIYRTTVMETAIPGDYLTNLASIYDYSSMPGAVIPERDYRDFDGAFASDPIPLPDACSGFIVLGVGLLKSDDPDPVEPGGVLTYTLTFSNSSGLYGAVDARITDTYDTNLTYLGATVSNASLIHGPYTAGPNTLYWTIDFLPNNNPTEYWIKPFFQVTEPFDPAQVPLVNTAGIDGGGDRTGVVWRTEETALKMPTLQIHKSGTPTYVPAGGTIVYTLRFTNTADYPVTATEVMVEDNYDTHVNFVAADPAPINPPDNNQWSLAPLGAGDSGSIKVTVTVDLPVPAGVTEVINRASISCDEVLPSASPELHTALDVPILDISTVDYPDPVSPTQSLVYTIAFTNTGTENATSPVLVNTLDPNVTFFDATPDPVGNACPGQVCTWNLPNLNQGSFSKVTLYVNVAGEIPPGVARLVNHAALSAGQVGPNTDIEYTAIWGAGGIYGIYLPLIVKQAPSSLTR